MSLQLETGVLCGCLDAAFCRICCVILRLLFAVAVVMILMLVAMASVVESVLD
jgi:hypothetical protein